jgi:hypothetical protein
MVIGIGYVGGFVLVHDGHLRFVAVAALRRVTHQ